MVARKNILNSDYPVLVLAVFAALILLPMLETGLVTGDDVVRHVFWTNYFAKELFAGDLYPRWLTDMNMGYGSPVFYFYPPLAFYINSALSLLINPATHPQYILGISLYVSFVIGGYGAYCWVEALAGRPAGVIAALVYMVLPYHAVMDVYLRGSFAEVWAMAFVPYMFFAATQLGKNNLKFYLFASVSVFLLLITHPPSALISIPLFCVYALWRLYKYCRENLLASGVSFGLAVVTGFMLSAFYVYPALTIRFNNMQIMWELVNYSKSFLYRANSFQDQELTWINGISLFTAVFGIWFAAMGVKHSSRKQPDIKPVFWFLLLCTFMTTPLSRPVWEYLAILQKIQLVWRYNTLVTLFAAFSAGIWLSEIRASEKKVDRRHAYALYFIIAACALLAVVVGMNKTEYRNKHDVAAWYKYNYDAPEYNLGNGLILSDIHIFKDGKVSTNAGKTKVEKWTADEIQFSGHFKAGTSITLKRYMFGRWQTIIDGALSQDARPIADKNGFMALKLQHPASQIVLKRIEFRQIRTGNLLSVLGLLLFIAFLLSMRLVPSLVSRRQSS